MCGFFKIKKKHYSGNILSETKLYCTPVTLLLVLFSFYCQNKSKWNDSLCLKYSTMLYCYFLSRDPQKQQQMAFNLDRVVWRYDSKILQSSSFPWLRLNSLLFLYHSFRILIFSSSRPILFFVIFLRFFRFVYLKKKRILKTLDTSSPTPFSSFLFTEPALEYCLLALSVLCITYSYCLSKHHYLLILI